MTDIIVYSSILLIGVFISAVSQVILKKEAMSKHDSVSEEYLNTRVMFAYLLFIGTTFLCIIAYKVVPLSMGPILEATSYIWVTLFGITIFKEKMTTRKAIALVMILCGIIMFSTLG